MRAWLGVALAGPQVCSPQGCVQGSVHASGAREFLGVPYAQPPTGPRRFRPPEALPAWSGVRDAQCHKSLVTQSCQVPVCLQTSPLTPAKGLSPWPVGPGQEDCLVLHVYAPSEADGAAPVLFFVHGGGFQTGDGLFLGMYSGAELAQQHKMVVVSANYRLGALGWLAHPDLSHADGSGNFGLLDQLQALAWVQENIASFGGDASRVTLCGQSAGAMSIAALLVAERAAGLFHGAVLESGSFDGGEYYQAAEHAEQFGRAWLQTAGCPGPGVRACAQALDAAALQSATPFPQRPPGAPLLYPVMPWGVVLGGLVPATPLARVAQGQFHKVPVLLGSNRDEGTMFLSALATVTTPAVPFPFAAQEDSVALLSHFMPEAVVESALAHYPLEQYGANCTHCKLQTKTRQECLLKWQANAVLRDYFFACPARRFARELTKHNTSAFAYDFAFDFGGGLYESAAFGCKALKCVPGPGGLGVFHMSELPFVFGSKSAMTTKLFVGSVTDLVHGGWTARHANMSAVVQGFWARMVRAGAPAADWPRVEDDERLALDLPPKQVADRRAACDFWDAPGAPGPVLV